MPQNYPDTYQLIFGITAKASGLVSLSLEVIPYHASEIKVALFLNRFWLKHLGRNLTAHKRESKLLSLLLDGLPHLATNTVPTTSQAHGLWLRRGYAVRTPPLHPSSNYFPCLEDSLFPLTYQNTNYLTSSSQVFPSCWPGSYSISDLSSLWIHIAYSWGPYSQFCMWHFLSCEFTFHGSKCCLSNYLELLGTKPAYSLYPWQCFSTVSWM